MLLGNISDAVDDGTDKTGKSTICKAPSFLSLSLHKFFLLLLQYHLIWSGEAAVPQVCARRHKRVESGHRDRSHAGGWHARRPWSCLEEETWGGCGLAGRWGGGCGAAQLWAEEGRKWMYLTGYYMCCKKLPTSNNIFLIFWYSGPLVVQSLPQINILDLFVFCKKILGNICQLHCRTLSNWLESNLPNNSIQVRLCWTITRIWFNVIRSK